MIAIDSEIMVDRNWLLWLSTLAVDKEYVITKDIARIVAVIEYVRNLRAIFSVKLTPILFQTMSSGSGAGNTLRS